MNMMIKSILESKDVRTALAQLDGAKSITEGAASSMSDEELLKAVEWFIDLMKETKPGEEVSKSVSARGSELLDELLLRYRKFMRMSW